MKGPEVAIKAGRENKQSQNKEEEQIQVDRVHSEGRINPPRADCVGLIFALMLRLRWPMNLPGSVALCNRIQFGSL